MTNRRKVTKLINKIYQINKPQINMKKKDMSTKNFQNTN